MFENLARTAARAQGYPELRMIVLPHPMESRPEDALRALARAHAPSIFALLAEDA